MSQFKDLEQIVGKSEKVKLRDKEFEVFELSIKSILNVFKKIGSLDITNTNNFLKALADNFDIAVELVAHATKSPIADVKKAVDNNQISLDEFTTLTTKAVEVNADVFLSAIEKIKEVGDRLSTQATSLNKKS